MGNFRREHKRTMFCDNVRDMKFRMSGSDIRESIWTVLVIMSSVPSRGTSAPLAILVFLARCKPGKRFFSSGQCMMWRSRTLYSFNVNFAGLPKHILITSMVTSGEANSRRSARTSSTPGCRMYISVSSRGT